MGTLTTIAIIAVGFILSLFGVHSFGKKAGKEEQKKEDELKSVKQETVILKSEAEAKKQSEKISREVEKEVSDMRPGDANQWLREHANRDRK